MDLTTDLTTGHTPTVVHGHVHFSVDIHDEQPWAPLVAHGRAHNHVHMSMDVHGHNYREVGGPDQGSVHARAVVPLSPWCSEVFERVKLWRERGWADTIDF